MSPAYDQGRPMSLEEELALRQRVMAAISAMDPLSAHAKAVGQLDPMIAAIDAITFEADFSTAGAISGKTIAQKTPGGYWAELYAISGYFQKPGTNPEVLPGVKFNVKDQERSGDFFSTDINLASFVSLADGCGRLDLPRGLYLFRPASGVLVTWDSDTTIYTGASAKRCGVMLHLNLWGTS